VADGGEAPPGNPVRGVDRRRRLAKPGILRLCVAEPFRVFFPLALLVSVVAVMLWPAMFWQWISFYPKDMHGRLLLQGFVGGFAFGFLGTALPNVLTSRKFTGVEVLVLLGLYVAMIACHLGQRAAWGDGLFLVMLVVFGAGLVWRLATRGDVPPPGFVLVGGGLLCAAAGTALLLAGRLGPADPLRMQLGSLLLHEGFLLLPVLGIGAFLFPRFFGTRNTHIFPDQRTPPPGWWAKALVATAVGVIVIASFVMEAVGMEAAAAWVRFAVCAAYLSTETGWWRKPDKGGIMPWGLRLGILFTLGAYLVHGVLHVTPATFSPMQQVAVSHLLYVGGFGLFALVVGTRVMLGHAGQSQLMQRWLKPVVWMMVLVLLAALTRATADFMPKIMVSHWKYAAYSWVCGAVVWGIFVLPWVLRPDEEEE
jgi:uncharacterized protein involved in response to NO